MAEVTMRRRFTAELSVRVEDLIAAARRRYRLLAVVAVFEFPAVGLLVDWLVDSEGGWGLFTVLASAVGLLSILMILDWGRKLDQRPKAMNLVKARNGAFLLHGLLPLGPIFAKGLLEILRHPTLAGYAVANHPDAERLDNEVVLAVVRMRSAFITMRRVGYLLVFLAVMAFLVFDKTVGEALDSGIRIDSLWSSIIVAFFALAHLVVGFLAGGLLKELTDRRLKKIRRFTPLIGALFPFGTYAAWSAHQLDPDELPSAEESNGRASGGRRPGQVEKPEAVRENERKAKTDAVEHSQGSAERNRTDPAVTEKRTAAVATSGEPEIFDAAEKSEKTAMSEPGKTDKPIGAGSGEASEKTAQNQGVGGQDAEHATPQGEPAE